MFEVTRTRLDVNDCIGTLQCEKIIVQVKHTRHESETLNDKKRKRVFGNVELILIFWCIEIFIKTMRKI